MHVLPTTPVEVPLLAHGPCETRTIRLGELGIETWPTSCPSCSYIDGVLYRICYKNIDFAYVDAWIVENPHSTKTTGRYGYSAVYVGYVAYDLVVVLGRAILDLHTGT